jgi:uroporphyrin-III C-methyltransferase/precorrin-2 dehydrogenase/sirohydrochlorin ferrochelatase
LVVGGGHVAARKVALLRRALAKVRVVAPELCDELLVLVQSGAVEHRAGEYRAADLDGAEVVVAATDDVTVNEAVSVDARARRIWVNVVDTPALCTFIVPSIVDRAPLVVAVSTGGAAPVLARRVRTQLEALLPAGLGEVAALAARLRGEVKVRFPDIAPRRAFWERVFDAPARHSLLGHDPASRERELRDWIGAGETGPGTLHLIAIRTADPDDLSLRALHCLQAASLVAVCGDVAEAVLDLARRDARRERLPSDAGLAANRCMAVYAIRVRGGEQVCVLAHHDGFGSVEVAFAAAAESEGIAWRSVDRPIGA